MSENESTLHICVHLEGTLRRNVNVTLQAQDLTAQGTTHDIIWCSLTVYLLSIASFDYINDFTNLITFTPNTSNMICQDIRVVSDNVIENSERFVIFLDSLDSSVILPDKNRTVLLLDSTGKLHCMLPLPPSYRTLS